MWQFDPSRHLLKRGDHERRLEPKAVAVLARLVRADGAVVTKDELLEAAWPGRYVTDEVLTNAIYQLRKALEDDASDPTYIETIPKRGYRLITSLDTPSEPPTNESAGTEHRWIAAAIVSLAVGLVGGAPADRSTSIGPEEPSRPDRPSADLVERGWEDLDSARPDAAEVAAVRAEEALRHAPESADAWALAATATSLRAARGDAPDRRRAFDRALAAAERALAIAPGHPRALAARARARWLGTWDWKSAESDLVAALERSPEVAALWIDWAELLFFSGRVDEALRSTDRALRLDVDSPRARMTAGLLASIAGEPDEAVAHYQAVLEVEPRHTAARRQLEKLERPATVRSTAERLEGLTRKERVRPGHLALWFLESGDESAALEWLERAVEEHDPTILFFRYDSRWDRLRSDPRYRAVMGRAGLVAAS